MKNYTNKQLADDYLEGKIIESEGTGMNPRAAHQYKLIQKKITRCRTNIPKMYSKYKNLERLKSKELGAKTISFLEYLLEEKLKIPRKVYKKELKEKQKGVEKKTVLINMGPKLVKMDLSEYL
ncbi:hypothetical protein ACFLZZ_03960 [Nanoarchaeota archaeon]